MHSIIVLMTVNGMPLHPLVVHATVVCLPVTALVAIAFLNPRWRDWLRWPLLGLAVLSVVLVWLTASSGDDLKHDQFATAVGALRDRIENHEMWAGRLEVATYVFGGIVAVTTLLWRRLAMLLPVLIGLTALGGIAVAVLCVITGDAGARAVWAQ